jgi:hypothetical protein
MGCLFLLALDSGRRIIEVKYICFDKKSVIDNQMEYIPVWYPRVHSSHVIAWRILTNAIFLVLNFSIKLVRIQLMLLECTQATIFKAHSFSLEDKRFCPKRYSDILILRLEWDLLEERFLCKVGENSSSNDMARMHSRIPYNISWILTNFMLKFNTKNIAVSYIWKRVMPEYIGESNPWFIYENYITLLKLILLLLLFPILILLFLKV